MTDACVIGDSLPAFAAALELAEVGLHVRLVLPADGRGDWPDTGERDPDGSISGLLDRVAAPISAGGAGAPEALPMTVPPRRVLMKDARGDWSPLPEPEVFGIPAVPAASETLAFLRGGAAVRAYLDRVKPLLTIGKTHDLGDLVRLRMGDAARERLVVPLVRERFGAPDVEVAIAAPGLNEALTLAGSLSGAVLAYSVRNVARETRVTPAGGWNALRSALLERLGLYGVEISAAVDESAPGTRTLEARAHQGAWFVTVSGAEGESEFEAQALVVDADVELPGSLAEVLTLQRAARVRARAVVPVVAEGPITEAVEAGVDGDPAEALLTVETEDGEPWSVRVERDGSGGLIARAAGPAFEAADGDAAERPAAAAREAFSAAGLTALAQPESDVRAAPYLAIAERDAARARVAGEREADPSLLVVGRALHGDDLGAAVADAVLATIGLRRRLTGIAD